MSDLIQRGDVFKALWARHKHEGMGLDALITMEDALAAVVSIPAVDAVEVKHGRFVGTEADGDADGYPVYYEWKCSECGCIFEDDEPLYKYCPNCGAKMDGGKDDAAD